jgi:hypothetical protein
MQNLCKQQKKLYYNDHLNSLYGKGLRMNCSTYFLIALFSINHLHGAAANATETPKAKDHAKRVAAAKAKLAAANGMVTVNFLNAQDGSVLGSQLFSANTKLATINEAAQKLSNVSTVRLEVSTLDPAKATNQLEDTFGFRRTDRFTLLSQVPHRNGEPNTRHILVHRLQPSNSQLISITEGANPASAITATASSTCATTTSTTAPSNAAASAAAAAAQAVLPMHATAPAATTPFLPAASGKKKSKLLHAFLARTGSKSGKSGDSKKDASTKK